MLATSAVIAPLRASIGNTWEGPSSDPRRPRPKRRRVNRRYRPFPPPAQATPHPTAVPLAKVTSTISTPDRHRTRASRLVGTGHLSGMGRWISPKSSPSRPTGINERCKWLRIPFAVWNNNSSPAGRSSAWPLTVPAQNRNRRARPLPPLDRAQVTDPADTWMRVLLEQNQRRRQVRILRLGRMPSNHLVGLDLLRLSPAPDPPRLDRSTVMLLSRRILLRENGSVVQLNCRNPVAESSPCPSDFSITAIVNAIRKK